MRKKRLYTKPVGIILTDETFAMIDQICNQLEISISEWIRMAIDEKIAREGIQEDKR